MKNQKTTALLLTTLSLALLVSGCKKTPPAPPPPPPKPAETTLAPPPPAPPSIQRFLIEPASIQRGQSATLSWTVQNATQVTIDNGVGTVAASGTQSVSPASSVTYTLVARGAGGERTSTARITVTTAPAPPPPPPAAIPSRSLQERLQSEVNDVLFDYDRYDVREDGRATMIRNAEALKAILRDFPSAVIQIEGHCDERGSAEYNLGLGDRRGTSAMEFLIQVGVAADRLRVISYGKEKPQCTEGTEECYQKNRRAHFVPAQ
jgi:peptidoglycan-associated lipoprotein